MHYTAIRSLLLILSRFIGLPRFSYLPFNSIRPVARKVVKLVSITTQKKDSKIHQNFVDEGPMCIFYGTRLKKSFFTADSFEKNDLSTDGRRGTDVTQLHLQHTKNVFVVIPDQLQTFFSSTGNISIEKNHTIITESPVNIIMLLQ